VWLISYNYLWNAHHILYKTNEIHRHTAINNCYLFQFCCRCQQSTWSSFPCKHLDSSNSSMCPVVPSGAGMLFIEVYRDTSCCVEGDISEIILYWRALPSGTFWRNVKKLEHSTLCHVPENVNLIVTTMRITNLAHYILFTLQYCVKSAVSEFYKP
jgi:hypothetical protein